MVDDNNYLEKEIMGIPVIKQSNFDPEKFKVVVAVGDSKRRKQIVRKLPIQTRYTSIIHPSAVISKWVEIGEGSIITAGVILTCNIKIGKHAHLNLHTTVGHDCQIGDFFTAAPAVNISGNCTMGDCVYWGTNSSVRQGIKICDDVTIGMGGVVVKDIDNRGVYIGNPVRKLQS
jgi:sugar O-acyltransferase (sialic acid O-acetyltransferase NeuD family)